MEKSHGASLVVQLNDVAHQNRKLYFGCQVGVLLVVAAAAAAAAALIVVALVVAEFHYDKRKIWHTWELPVLTV